MKFSENLIEAMDWSGVGCRQLAEAVHGTVGQVYHWRSGANVPHPEIIGLIADALGCTCDWLIRGRL